MWRTIWLATALPAMGLCGETGAELAEMQPPSGWMLALLVGVGFKIYKTLRT
ncbi:MAG: hypothetical protein JNK48_00210 [Bryobacterales bacterium]|nr:hypothetical protein [Bryobacterales bacterium]